MNQIKMIKTLKQRIKHLRGRHDQLDHAWNRGTGGGTVSGDDYQAAVKLLDQQVADGEIDQEIADRTRAVLRKKANQSYDAMKRASLGMGILSRRQQASTQLADIRANDIASAAQQGQLANQNNVTGTQPIADTQIKPSKYRDKFSGLTSLQDIVNQGTAILSSADEAPATTEELVDFLSNLPKGTMIFDGIYNERGEIEVLGIYDFESQLGRTAQKIAEKNEENGVPLDVITVGDNQFTTRPIRTWEQLASIADKVKNNFKHTLDMNSTAKLQLNVFSQHGANPLLIFQNISRETPPRIINFEGLKIYTGPKPKNEHEKSWLKLFYGDDVTFTDAEFGNSRYSRVDPSLVQEPEWVAGVIPETQLNEFRKKYNIEKSNSEFQKIVDNFTDEEKQTWDMLLEKTEESMAEYHEGGSFPISREGSNYFRFIAPEVERLANELGKDSPVVQKMQKTLDQMIIDKYKLPTPPDYLSAQDKETYQYYITDNLIKEVKTRGDKISFMDDRIMNLTQSIAEKVPETVSSALFAYVNKLRLERGLRGPIDRKFGSPGIIDMAKADAVIPNPNPSAIVDIGRQENQPMTPKESAQNIINVFNSTKTADGESTSEVEIANNAKENFSKLTTIIQQLSPKEQMELIKNPRAMAMLQEAGLARSTMESLGIFGHPDTRLEIAKKSQGSMRESIDTNTVEVLLADYLKRIQDGKSQKEADEEFVTKIMNIHTTQAQKVLRTAAVHQLFSQVGPNAGVPADRIRSFYLPGIVPPEPHPLAVEIMNRVYERQQALFAKLGVTELPLYRGGPLQGGLPQESWSSAPKIAQIVAGATPEDTKSREFRAAVIPVKYMFLNYATWPGYSTYKNEEEHTILGASMYYDGETDVRTTGNVVNATTPRQTLLNVMPQFQPSEETMQFAVDKTRIQNIIDRLKRIGSQYFPTTKERSVKSIKKRIKHLSERY
jgi:hypothetical protein